MVILTWTTQKPTSTPAPTPIPEVQNQTATLIIDYGNNETTSYQQKLDENSTAFSILENATNELGITLITEQYDFGVFVKSINNLESTAEMAWIYFINGESGQIAADQAKLDTNDTVEWKYLEPNY